MQSTLSEDIKNLWQNTIEYDAFYKLVESAYRSYCGLFKNYGRGE
jgi:hypothetical protein